MALPVSAAAAAGMKHAVTFLFLLAAIAFYALGAVGPGTVFLALGAAAEGVFWYRILRKKRR